MTAEEQARLMLAHHGPRAQQLAIDSLVDAIKHRDETAIAERGAILRALDANLEGEPIGADPRT